MSVFSHFKINKWKYYSPQKRLYVLKKVEKKFARKQWRPKATVYAVDGISGWGTYKYNHNKPQIRINTQLLTDPSLRFHALNVIIHEGRHAYQCHVVRKAWRPSKKIRAKKWHENKRGYISPDQCGVAYRMQSVERDANKYALKYLEKLSKKYRLEPNFQSAWQTYKDSYRKAEKDARNIYGDNFKREIKKMISQQQKR